MSGAVYPIGFSYTAEVTASDTDDLTDLNCIGLCNKNLTTSGVVKVLYHNGDTGIIPLMAGQYVAVARVKRVYVTDTTAGIATDIVALYG